MALKEGARGPRRRAEGGRARHSAREVALQALYGWKLGGGDVLEHARTLQGWERCDQPFAEALVRGVMAEGDALEQRIAPHLDRSLASLSPVERVILLLGTHELAAMPETPFKVVLNEAIELGKSFGGAGGHKFVNGVLEKLAAELRGEEIARARQAARGQSA